jgi:hypothetical protein
MENGQPVGDKKKWKEHRSELKSKWQQVLGPLPQKAPLNIEYLERETLPSFTRAHIRYQLEPGIYTDAYLLTPRAQQKKRAAVVVFHPTTPFHAKGVAGLEKDYAEEKWQGVQLVERGYVVLCPRNYINTDGADWASNAKRLLARHPNWTGVTEMIWEGMRAADFLETLPNVDKNRIGCLGHSLGGKQAFFVAAFDERYQACVASELGIGLKYSNWDAPWYFGDALKNKPLDNHQLLALIAPRPFMLLAGDSADGDKSLNYISAAMPAYELLGARTNLQFMNHHLGHRYAPEARAAAEKFLDEHLRK